MKRKHLRGAVAAVVLGICSLGAGTSGPAAVQSVGADTLHLTYPDGAHDAETLMVDPMTGELIVVTKKITGGTVGIYRAPAGLAAGSTTQLEKVDDLTYGTGLVNAVTGGDVAADGSAVVIRTYGFVRVYNRVKQNALWTAFRSTACNAPLPSELQGEAVTFAPDARSLVTVAEGTNQTLHISSLP